MDAHNVCLSASALFVEKRDVFVVVKDAVQKRSISSSNEILSSIHFIPLLKYKHKYISYISFTRGFVIQPQKLEYFLLAPANRYGTLPKIISGVSSFGYCTVIIELNAQF